MTALALKPSFRLCLGIFQFRPELHAEVIPPPFVITCAFLRDGNKVSELREMIAQSGLVICGSLQAVPKILGASEIWQAKVHTKT